MTSQDQDDARARKIARIRKLLALARDGGASEHEAATALQMAQALMETEGVIANASPYKFQFHDETGHTVVYALAGSGMSQQTIPTTGSVDDGDFPSEF